MRQSYAVLVAALVSGLGTGCAQRVVSEAGGDVSLASVSEGWGTTFRGREGWGATRGSVFARPAEGGTHVALTVEGGIPGSRYGWDLREGACGADGQRLGDSNAYQPVLLGDRGVGSTIAVIPVLLETGRQYSVNLYGDASERTIVIGCGALAK